MDTDQRTCGLTGQPLAPGAGYHVMFRDQFVGYLSEDALPEFVKFLRFMLYLDFKILTASEISPGVVEIRVIGDEKYREFKRVFGELARLVKDG